MITLSFVVEKGNIVCELSIVSGGYRHSMSLSEDTYVIKSSRIPVSSAVHDMFDRIARSFESKGFDLKGVDQKSFDVFCDLAERAVECGQCTASIEFK